MKLRRAGESKLARNGKEIVMVVRVVRMMV